MLRNIKLNKKLNYLNTLSGYKLLTKSDIVRRAQGVDMENYSNEEQEEILPQSCAHKWALLNVERLISIFGGRRQWEICSILTLHKIRSQIRVKFHNKKKETGTYLFFNKLTLTHHELLLYCNNISTVFIGLLYIPF